MSEVFRPLDNRIYQDWITTISEESSDALNDWEIKFITSIQQRITVGLPLFEDQHVKLEQIYVKHTS